LFATFVGDVALISLFIAWDPLSRAVRQHYRTYSAYRAQVALDSFSLPEGTVVYADHPAELTVPAGRRDVGVAKFTTAIQSTTRPWIPLMWDDSILDTGAALSLGAWTQFRPGWDGGSDPWAKRPRPAVTATSGEMIGIVPPEDRGIVFAGTMKNAAGIERIVCVTTSDIGPEILVHVLVPGTRFARATWAGTDASVQICRARIKDRVEILTGRLGETSESAFVVPLRVNGEAFTLRGTLGGDDSVTFTVSRGRLNLVTGGTWYLADDRKPDR
jgi:hypothetical protein